MPDILLYGATGYTGRLTAAALQRRDADFAIAGRDPAKLKALAAETGSPEMRVVPSGDVDALAEALQDVRTLITCVGPFVELGATAVEAALRAGVHYVDSTGEAPFIKQVIADHDLRARETGVAIGPALGFDEVPGDVAATLAADGLDNPAIDMTYALPRTGSAGTIRTSLGIMTSRATWLENGHRREVAAGEETRWAPMPSPLGPKLGRSFPLALGVLAPRHIDASTFRTYVTTGSVEGALMRFGIPVLKRALDSPLKGLIDKGIDRLPEGPEGDDRKRKWTILAEARSASGEWRNVTLTGPDVYGLTAETLSSAALRMAEPGYEGSGVLAPVEALGLERALDELSQGGVTVQTYAPV